MWVVNVVKKLRNMRCEAFGLFIFIGKIVLDYGFLFLFPQRQEIGFKKKK